jgi:hypothetical protein
MKTLEAMIAARFAAPAWAVFYEVANGTGFGDGGRRWADAVAIGIWPSRGHAIHGFEIKRSRGDWQRELADPTKADAVSKWCDFWWVVASDRAIVPLSELPETWGLLVPRGEGLVSVKDAPKREAAPLSRAFVAAMLRRVSETTVLKSTHEARIVAEVEERCAQRARYEGHDLKHALAKVEKLEGEIAAFEEASGIRLGGWLGGKKLGDAVKAFASRTHVTGRQRLEQAKRDLEAIVGYLDADIRAMPEEIE